GARAARNVRGADVALKQCGARRSGRGADLVDDVRPRRRIDDRVAEVDAGFFKPVDIYAVQNAGHDLTTREARSGRVLHFLKLRSSPRRISSTRRPAACGRGTREIWRRSGECRGSSPRTPWTAPGSTRGR